MKNMPTGLQTVSIEAYRFEAPCLVYEGGLRLFDDPECWQSGPAWLGSLEGLPHSPKAIVIPLELAASKRTRQDLLGYELLSFLRWANDESLAGVPVFLCAWQPLQDILLSKPDLLVVRPAVEFSRLPEAIDRLPGFINDVVEGRIRSASRDEIASIAGNADQEASRVSYHDLANDHYAAYRILKGYRSLLRQASASGVAEASRELQVLSETGYAWESYVEEKLRSPFIRRFQASRAGLSAPRYPAVEDSLEVVTYHLQQGLPAGTRVLLVDDEFHKGSAEALLRVLFRQASFTKRLTDEWVYSEETDKGPQDRWARFVCVRSAELAQNWLAYWDGIAEEETTSKAVWKHWLEQWDRELSPKAKRPKGPVEAEDVLAQGRDFVLDRHSAGPRVKSTVVLLDLRLEPVRNALYSIKEFSSYHLRRTIKSEQPDLPVVMFTASRQILNFAELLDSSTEIDGWFVKEGPDTPVDADDANSANAVTYLLERLHLYSTLRGWYRPSFAWDGERKLAYARLFHSPNANVIFEEITRLSNQLFQQVLAPEADQAKDSGETFLSFVQQRVPAGALSVVQTLVARRVALACLLWTADMTPAGPAWNADAFAQLLPGRPAKKTIKWVYDKLNFNQVLWMRSSDVLSQLLDEEVRWLAGVPWPNDRSSQIAAALQQQDRPIAIH